MWYRVLNAYSMVVSVLGSAYRVVRLGKTHQDVLLQRVEGMFPVLAAELSVLLRGGAVMDHSDNALRANIKALSEVVAPPSIRPIAGGAAAAAGDRLARLPPAAA